MQVKCGDPATIGMFNVASADWFAKWRPEAVIRCFALRVDRMRRLVRDCWRALADAGGVGVATRW